MDADYLMDIQLKLDNDASGEYRQSLVHRLDSYQATLNDIKATHLVPDEFSILDALDKALAAALSIITSYPSAESLHKSGNVTAFSNLFNL